MKKILPVLLVSLVSLVPFAALVPSVKAEPIDFSLYPPFTAIIATPSSRVVAPIRITNHAKTSQKIAVKLFDFKPSDEDGAISIDTQESKLDWIDFPSEINLRPDQTINLSINIDIPKDLRDYYFTVLFQTKNEVPIVYSTSRIETGIGSNILLSVYPALKSPDDKKQAEIVEFTTEKIYTGEPVAFTVRFENKGNQFFSAGGEIIITDISGREINKIKIAEKNILSSSIRNIAAGIEQIPSKNLFGKYEAILKTYIDDADGPTQTITFYVIPKDIAFITLGLFVLLTTIFVRLRYYLKKAKNQVKSK